MSKYGFIISKIIVTSKIKEDAILEFKKGLNVVSGASDTGKTYIFEIFDYMFGGAISPKEVKEGKDYNEIFMEIQCYNNKTYTLKRSLVDGKMLVYECDYNNINVCSPKNIIEKHNPKNKNNISNFFIDLCGAQYKIVVKNKNGISESFTFRDFVRLMMLNEESIISKKSVLLGNSPYKTTRNKNAFKTIITGIQDKGKKTDKEKEILFIKINAKVELIDNLILQYTNELKGLQININDVDENLNFDESIKKIEEVIKYKNQEINCIELKQLYLINEALKYKRKIEYNLKVIKKFKLLKENFLSDLIRIEFIDDANFYINQLDNVKCPICLSNIEKDSIDSSKLINSILEERKKINKQLKGIEETINNLINSNKNLKVDLSKNEKIKSKLDIKIEKKLKPILDLKLSELNAFLYRRDILKRKEYITNKIIECREDKEKLLNNNTNTKNEEVQIYKINQDNLKDICKIIEDVLKEWKLFNNPNVEFDLKEFDLKINDKKKSSFGKGFRAIINSSLILGIMKYILQKNLPHPKVIILDSPLTTYKEKDDNNEEIVNDLVKKSFYQYLSNSFKSEQIIVFENVDPNEELCNQINYYHFSKNKRKGRYGFFNA